MRVDQWFCEFGDISSDKPAIIFKSENDFKKTITWKELNLNVAKISSYIKNNIECDINIFKYPTDILNALEIEEPETRHLTQMQEASLFSERPFYPVGSH